MLERLADIERRYEELSDLINDPEIIADNERWRKLMKEHSDITPIVEKYREYKKIKEELAEAEEMLNDSSIDDDFKSLVKEEFSENKKKIVDTEEELKILMLPKDPNDDKNVIVEIRGGAGGDEANIFAGDLYRMYSRYAERRRWKTEIMSVNESEAGGFREISFMISGQGAYSRLKYESGVHRVQRIPETESQGRVHTSAVTVAVLPEAEDVDIDIKRDDLRIDVYRSSGAGGQHINKTSSAIRITHIPSGMVVTCQNERSQRQNKEKALQILKSRLYDQALQNSQSKEAEDRKNQVGSGDRSERIRTYNFPQGRVTDHRINMSIYQLDDFLNGDMDAILDRLIEEDLSRRMKEGDSSGR